MQIDSALSPLAPPSTPEPGGPWPEFGNIRVTQVVQTSRTPPEREFEFPSPADPSWKLICFPAHQIESEHAIWLHSERAVKLSGKTEDGKFYEAVVHKSFAPRLHFWDKAFYLDYDPTAPTNEDILTYGRLEAVKKGRIRFLHKAANTIRSTHSMEYENCCRVLAQSIGLGTALERALLIHDILKSKLPIRKRFAQYLVFIGLNALPSYESWEALELLSKDTAQLLQPFQDCCTNPLKDLSERGTPTWRSSELQTIFLIRLLVELSGGFVDRRQHTFDQGYTSSENLSLYGSLIGVTGTNPFGDFDAEDMHNALLQSRIFAGEEGFDTVAWKLHVVQNLPIGIRGEYSDLPPQVLHELNTEQVAQMMTYFAHIYHRNLALRKPANNVLLLLTWTSIIHDRPLEVITDWACSPDALILHKQLLNDFQDCQEPEQLVLILAALLCHERLLPYSSEDTLQPMNGCYLADMNVLLSGRSLSNQRAVIERMCYASLRVLDTLPGDYKNMSGLFFGALKTDELPLLDTLDGFTDHYLAQRIKNRLSHLTAYTEAMALSPAARVMLELSGDVSSIQANINSISEDYCVVMNDPKEQ